MNTIELPVSELRTALNGLNKVISKTTCLPILKNVRLTRTPSGRVTIEGTDLDNSAIYQAEAHQPGAEYDVLVPIEPLAKIVKTSANDSRIGFLKDKGLLTLRSYVGSSPVDQQLETMDLQEWPPVPTLDIPPVTLNKELREAVSSAMKCSGEDSSRSVLQGTWIDTSDPKAHYVMATNGQHLFSSNSFTVASKESIFLPNAKFVQWSGFMDDGDWNVSVKAAEKKDEHSWLQMKSDHWTFISKSGNDRCPNWRQVIPSRTESKTHVHFSERAIDFLLKLLPSLPASDDYYRPVTIEFGNGMKVKAHARNSDSWTCVEVPEVEVSGRPITVAFKREYLMKAMSFGLVDVDLIDSMTPVVFYNGGKRLVVVPYRLEEPAPATEATSDPTPVTKNNNEPQPQPQPKSEERKEMKTEPKTTTEPETKSETKAVTQETQETQESKPADTEQKSLLQHIDLVKESMKAVIRGLNDLLDMAKKTEKEKRASDKEIEAVRAKLREIQSVTI